MKRLRDSILARAMAVVLAVSMVLSGTSIGNVNMNAFAADEIVYGDANGDGDVTAEDALMALKHTVKLMTLDEQQVVRTEVDGNEDVNAEDALWILKYVVKLIDKFPVQEMEVNPTETPVPTTEPTSAPTENVPVETFTPGPTTAPTEIVPVETPTPGPTATVVPTEVVPIETPTPAPTDPVVIETTTPVPTETVVPTETPTPIPFGGTLYIAGDSIADGVDIENFDGDPIGWGDIIYTNYTNDVTVNNQAHAGDSALSFYYDYDNDGDGDGHRYKAIYDNIKANDCVIISFGHNDANPAANRYASPTEGSDVKGSFKWYLKEKFIDPALAVGAVPVLMTSVVRCTYVDGKFTETETHLQYGQAMRELVAEYADKGVTVYLIDAQKFTYDTYSTLTYDEAKQYHPLDTSGKLDVTHYNEMGAHWMADFISGELAKYPIGINNYLIGQTPDDTETPAPDEQLIPFSGKVWICADSIAAVHGKDGYERPVYGWGEIIGDYFTSDVTFENYAKSGDSTRSYYYDGLGHSYKAVYQNLSKNDYVIISFGHNDHGGVASRETDATKGSDVEGSYKWYLKEKYIEPALAAGAVPILMSSIVRCNYENGKFVEEEEHLLYGKAMKELVEEYAAQGVTIPFIDAQSYTYNLYSGLTYEQASLYHALYQPGDWYFDNTHYSNAGAKMICEYITSELEKTSLQIKTYIK